MNITLNDKPFALEGSTVADLANQLGFGHAGTAIAIDMEIVPHEEWETTKLAEGANVFVIRAASGG